MTAEEMANAKELHGRLKKLRRAGQKFIQVKVTLAKNPKGEKKMRTPLGTGLVEGVRAYLAEGTLGPDGEKVMHFDAFVRVKIWDALAIIDRQLKLAKVQA